MPVFWYNIYSLHTDIKNTDKSLTIAYKVCFNNFKKTANYDMTTFAAMICRLNIAKHYIFIQTVAFALKTRVNSVFCTNY